MQNARVHVIENAVIEDDANGQEVEIVNTVSVAEIEIGNVIGSAIGRGKETAIGTGNVITANHIQESDRAAEKENANVKEIVNIEKEAGKKGKSHMITRLNLIVFDSVCSL